MDQGVLVALKRIYKKKLLSRLTLADEDDINCRFLKVYQYESNGRSCQGGMG